MQTNNLAIKKYKLKNN